MDDKIIYTLRRSARKTICISISNDGKVVVSAPKSCKIETIERFLLEKQGWIFKKLKNAEKTRALLSQFDDDHTVIFGEKYQIIIDSDVKKTCLKQGIVALPIKYANNPTVAIKKLLCELSTEVLTREINEISSVFPAKFIHVSLSNARTKWGSCDSQSRLKFNLRVAMLPREIIEYVIIHELCHLIELNHSARFWQLVERYCPNYKLLKKQLKQFSFYTELYR